MFGDFPGCADFGLVHPFAAFSPDHVSVAPATATPPVLGETNANQQQGSNCEQDDSDSPGG
jgi:hypothetical protein